MSCDKGYKGDCCCKCDYQYPIDVCECSVCSKVEGWICTIFVVMSGVEGKRGVMKHSENEHGCCETFKKREN